MYTHTSSLWKAAWAAIFVISFLAIRVSAVSAANCTWTGTNSTDWADPDNWSNCNGFTPGAADTATIPNIATDPILATDTTLGGLTINNGGFVTLESGITLTVTGATVLQGTLTGPGDFVVNGPITWSAGMMSGTGSTTLTPGNVATLSGSSKTLDGRIFNNNGTINWVGATQVILSGGAILNNLPGATFDIQNDAPMNIGTGGGTFNNQGNFIKSGGTSTTNISPVFNNDSTVTVQTNTLSFNGSGDSNGTFTINAGATLRFQGTTHTLADGSHIGGAGNLTVAGTSTVVNLDGKYVVTGQTTFSGGIVNLNNQLEIPNLTVSGGVMQGSSNITVTNVLSWTGGTIGGSGILTAPAGITFTIGGLSKTLNGRILNNYTHAIWAGATQIQVEGGATINNLPTATWEIQSDTSISSGTGGGTFNNQGLLLKSIGTGTTNIDIPLHNVGSIAVQSGTLLLDANGTHTGTFDVTAGATLRFDGVSHTLEPVSAINGAGNVTFGTSAVVVDVNGAYNITGITTVNGGTVNFNQPLTLPILTFTNGTLFNSQPITVTNALNWSGGTMNGGSTTLVAPGATLTISGVSKTLDGRILNHAGTGTWTGTTQLLGQNGAVINILPGATLEQQGDSNWAAGTGGATFNNQGIFFKSAGTNTLTISMVVNNSGTFQVASGTLLFNTGITSSGIWQVDGIGTTRFDAGSHMFTPGSLVTGSGQMMFGTGASTAVISGTYNMSGTTTVNGGTADFAADTTIGTLAISGGTLRGNGNVTITTAFNWSGGTMAGSGSTSVQPGATVTFSGGTKTLNGRILNNASPAIWTSNANIVGQNGASFNQLPTASLDIQATGSLVGSTGGATFNNQGSILKTGGDGTNTISMAFHNSGSLTILTGTVQLNGGGSNTGLITGTHNLTFGGNSSVFTMTGEYDVSGVTAVTNGTVLFNVPTTIPQLGISNGTFSGTAPITISQYLVWGGGTIGGPQEMHITAGATVGIGGNTTKTLNGRLFNNAGYTIWTGLGNVQVQNSAVFNNLPGATLELQSSASLLSSTDDGIFINAGNILKTTDPQIATFQVDVYHTGAVEVLSGTLRFNHPLDSTGTFAGPGNIALGNNVLTATLAGPYHVTGTTSIDNGAVSFTHPDGATFGSLVQNGGSLSLTNTMYTVLGDFVLDGNGFTANASTLSFSGATLQTFAIHDPTDFYNLAVGPGTTLVETVAEDNATVNGTLTNEGVIRKTQASTGNGTLTFGLTGVTVEVVNDGRLDSLQVDRIDSNHPSATTQTATGRYWIITADGNSYLTHLTLSHNIIPSRDAQVCRYTNNNWVCTRAWYTATTVTLPNVTSFGDWAVGSGPMYDLFLPFAVSE